MDRRRLEDAFFLFAGLEVVHKWNIDIGSVLFDDAFLGAVHTSDLDRSEIDLEPYRAKCGQPEMSRDRIEIELN